MGKKERERSRAVSVSRTSESGDSGVVESGDASGQSSGDISVPDATTAHTPESSVEVIAKATVRKRPGVLGRIDTVEEVLKTAVEAEFNRQKTLLARFRFLPRFDNRCTANTVTLHGSFGWLGTEDDWANRRRDADMLLSEAALRSTSEDLQSLVGTIDLAASDRLGSKRTCWIKLRRRVRTIARAAFVACCPPCRPRRIAEGAAFPRPKTSYRFYTREGVVTESNRHSWPLDEPIFSVDYADAQYGTNTSGLSLYELRGFLVETSRGSLIAGVWLPAHFPNPTCTILYSHANAADIGRSLSMVYTLRRKLNANVLAYDYSGYGLSTGRPSEKNLYADIEAMYQWLVETRNIEAKRIVLVGFSMGTAASAHLAAVKPEIGGLALCGAFASVLNVVPGLDWLVDVDKPRPHLDILKTYEKLPNITQKVLVVHGCQDSLIDMKNARFVCSSLKRLARPLFILEAAHNDLECQPQLFYRLHEYVAEDLGLGIPYAPLRAAYRDLLAHQLHPPPHPACIAALNPTKTCVDCRRSLVARFYNPRHGKGQKRAERVPVDVPDAVGFEVDFVLPVEPRRVGRYWSGRYSVILVRQHLDSNLIIAGQDPPPIQEPFDPSIHLFHIPPTPTDNQPAS